jgi:hypothetical protein
MHLDDQHKFTSEPAVETNRRPQDELTRDGIDQVIQDHPAKRPRFHNAATVGRTEELMEGFGE